MGVIGEVVKERWHSRQDTLKLSATHHVVTIKEVEAKLTKLENAYIFEKVLPLDRYNEHRGVLEQQLNDARSLSLEDGSTSCRGRRR